MSVALRCASRSSTDLIFAVLLNDIAQFAEQRAKFGEVRNEFLASLKRQGRLVLEGTLGERGSMMVIEAESFSDVLSALQGDPYVVQPISSSVLIRSLEINVLGNTELLLNNHREGEQRGSKTSLETSGFRPLNRK